MEANNKVMREALIKIRDELHNPNHNQAIRDLEIEQLCDAALAAPPRNCDRFNTKEEAAMAFANEKKRWIPQGVLWELAPWLDWLFATAETKGENE